MPKLLLVEDIEMNIDMLSRRLMRRGYGVVMAVDGNDGLTMAGLESPSLILTHMALPGLNEWEVTRRSKADPETNSIPMIALTSQAMSGDRNQAMQAGCDGYATKPTEIPRLLEMIQALHEMDGAS